MKSSILTPLPLYLLLLFLNTTSLFSTPIYTPVDNIVLNCGSSGTSFNKYDNRSWTGDINSKLFSSESHPTTSQVKQAPPFSYAPPIPYSTARLSYSEFAYKFPLRAAGQKFIRLYFHPVSYPNFDRSISLFSVKAGTFTLLRDFNASVTADADASGVETLRREFCLNVDEEKSLTITFTPSKDCYAFINGIEIVSMPANLYHNASAGGQLTRYMTEDNFYIENTTAMEMVYRINVGGTELTFTQDTGMYRDWDGTTEEQNYYLDDSSARYSVTPTGVEIQPNFTRIPKYTAPKVVYQTARSMGNNKTINKSYNLTWVFPVDPEFHYLVRLHFCEFQPPITVVGDRVFLIYIANQTAEREADIIKWSGGNGIPLYRDYVVFVPTVRGKKKVNLFLALQANKNDSATGYTDAILDGLEIFKLSDANGNLAGPNPDAPAIKPGPESPSKHLKKKSTPMLAIIAGVVSSIFALVFVLGLCIIMRGRTKETSGSFLPSGLCREFSLKEIKAATKNFNKDFILGTGGFGDVYKGNIDRKCTPVAIKRLKPESHQGAVEFKTEIDMLSRLRHQHLVSLIGYCRDKNEMILVYEFMENGTLYEHLINPKSDKNPLPWERRLNICIGAARGLHYLHTGGADGTIIHRDVKSTNILLDEHWVAKVSDFGLSKMGTLTVSKTHITTMVKGSIGYLDPEYYLREQLTEKSDVYSFGVVLCEVLCARPAVLRGSVEKKEMGLAEWFKTCHRNGEVEQIIDANLKGKILDACFSKFVEIAVSCMHENGTKRPSMNDVVEALEFALQLQQSGDKGDHHVDYEKKDENSEDVMSSFGWEDSSDTKVSRVTNSSSEPSSSTSGSIKGMSGTVFSEIKNPDAR